MNFYRPPKSNILLLILVSAITCGIECVHWSRRSKQQGVFAEIDRQNPVLVDGAVDGEGEGGTDVGRETADVEKAEYIHRSSQVSQWRLPLWLLAATLSIVCIRQIRTPHHSNE